MNMKRKVCETKISTIRTVFTGIERSWTVADESPGGTETTTILNDVSSSDGTTPIFENERA
jgi:hypothetical protein